MAIDKKNYTVLFYVKSVRFLRYYKTLLEAFLTSGFRVHVIFDSTKSEGASDDSLKRMVNAFPLFTYDDAPTRVDWWRFVIIPCRNIRNYRFLLVTGQNEYRLRKLFPFLPQFIKKLLTYAPHLTASLLKSSLCEWFFVTIERWSTPGMRISLYVKKYRPDCVMVSFRNFPCKSPDIDYIKAGLSQKIPTAIIVPSWDNLTTKSLIQIIPDQVFVWNSEQAYLAEHNHHVPKDKIAIVGAPHFDHWFERKSTSMSREEFCVRFSLNPADSFLLYLGTSTLKERNADIVFQIHKALDARRTGLSSQVHILVRPYPGTDSLYASIKGKGISILSSGGDSKNTLEDDALFFDTAFHSFAACCVNTTALIDVMASGKPGIVLVRPEFALIQNEPYFRGVIDSGAVHQACSADDIVHVVQEILSGSGSTKMSRERYLNQQIRPRGLTRSVGLLIADEVRRLCKSI